MCSYVTRWANGRSRWSSRVRETILKTGRNPPLGLWAGLLKPWKILGFSMWSGPRFLSPESSNRRNISNLCKIDVVWVQFYTNLLCFEEGARYHASTFALISLEIIFEILRKSRTPRLPHFRRPSWSVPMNCRFFSCLSIHENWLCTNFQGDRSTLCRLGKF